jgi:citrate synthase
MSKAQAAWIGVDDALAQLSVRRQTLYAYVSRGLIRAQPDQDDPRRSLSSAHDIGGRAGPRYRPCAPPPALCALSLARGAPPVGV